jgi:hypothetical protein
VVEISEIDKALDAYGEAYELLWEQVQANPDQFPSCVLTPGTIAEYFAKKYLEEKYSNCSVMFGSSTEKAWDIKVCNNDGKDILLQVKSTTRYSKNRLITKIVKGFDQLIVITLDYDFFPLQAFLFEVASIFHGENRINTLTVPCVDHKSRKGSKVFSLARNIQEEFFEILANKL